LWHVHFSRGKHMVSRTWKGTHKWMQATFCKTVPDDRCPHVLVHLNFEFDQVAPQHASCCGGPVRPPAAKTLFHTIRMTRCTSSGSKQTCMPTCQPPHESMTRPDTYIYIDVYIHMCVFRPSSHLGNLPHEILIHEPMVKTWVVTLVEIKECPS
jgi:hypothetical protein